ncbi:MAG: Ig-like domain-containing protein [Chitinophagaceae bacterium]|nr:Ig-like domain-containing protein [Chitinophagaceae bacterium]
MKKNLFRSLLAVVFTFSSFLAAAQTEENFNSRPSVPLNGVKNHLQNHCWTFAGFDVNGNGWNANIEGDGAMVSQNHPSTSYMLSPVLSMNSPVMLSFNYKFHNIIGNGVRRWMTIYLADANNNLVELLDSVEFSNIDKNMVYTYSEGLEVTGAYKLYISYGGIGESTWIAIDQIKISSSLYYSGGCNSAPIAVNDNISGISNRSATGVVIINDSDPNGDQFSAYLMTPSPDGTVVLNTNGTFNFTPNPGFAGTSTSFTYKICDQGLGVLCSNDATVTISFQGSGILPVSLIDFNGLYRNEGKVELNWATSFEQNSDRFEIERSFDGIAWQKVGSMKAQGSSSVKKSYAFIDEAGRNTAIKKDLYYRLKQIDLDNKSAYSRILIVRVYNTQSIKMISVTPNPAKNDIAVNIQLNENSYVVMKVVSSNGTEVVKKSLKASAGANSYILEGTSKLQRGMYVLEVIVNSKERMLVTLMKE